MSVVPYRYRWVLADSAGHSLGELVSARDKRLTTVHNGIPSAGFSLSATNPLAIYLLDQDAELVLKIYSGADGVGWWPRFVGPVLSSSLLMTPYESTVQVEAIGPIWRLKHRLVGKTADASEQVMSGTKPALIRDILNALNSEGETGILVQPGLALPETGTTEVRYSYQEALEAILTLSAGQIGAGAADGVDIAVDPIEPAAGKIGQLRLGSPGDAEAIAPQLIGRRREAAIFELGPGSRQSLLELQINASRDGLANDIYNVHAGATPVVINQNSTASISERGRHEAVLRDDNTDVTLRTDLTATYLQVRQRPRQVITIKPAPEDTTGRIPLLDQDYGLGDVIRVRAWQEGYAAPINDSWLRVYSIQTAIDDADRATHTLVVTPE